MIPVISTRDQFCKARNGYVVCHPKNNGGKLSGDEKVIKRGNMNMLSTPITCGKRALITETDVICAINEDNMVLINPSGMMVPDAAECINEFLSDNRLHFEINKFRWTIRDNYVIPDSAMYTAAGVPIELDRSKEAGVQRKADKKMAAFYVDNVMDAVENKFKTDSPMTMWGFFSAAQEEHSKLNYAPSFEKSLSESRKTLYSLVFNLDMISRIGSNNGIQKSGLDVDETPIKKSTAKRLFLAYVCSKVGVPYVPMGIKELKKEVKS
jgi:hypothetical protein